MPCNEVLVEVKGLKKYFQAGRRRVVKAVDDVSFRIYRGETLGLVGESGCGKTTCGKAILGLLSLTEGEVVFDGMKVHRLEPGERKEFTKRAQIVYQDPYSSLNPRMTVKDIIGEGIEVHRLYRGKEQEERVCELLHTVGLNREHINRFPHEFSGGQRQRIGIARALAVEPDFVVCDEPMSALDVSIQAQITKLLLRLQREENLTYLFISHNLAMVKYVSDRVGVMYLGKLVELTTSEELYRNPLHPYTQALLSAIPVADPDEERSKERVVMKGEIPSAINPPAGCRFASRCRFVRQVCREDEPAFREVGKEHFVACHLAE